ncbi:hypothetical protein ACGLDM_004626 [Salmonella enterica subsp. enterica serovar Braenderup]|nr:hypothetical protein [Salmonella enterica]EBY0658902.1 hypothetical protein [Salmonella enterica subsp. enterica serovar Newport]ECS6386594.1 hypothetical protein [Salmonella enterica subsp. enterica serovar Saintpaul]MDR5246954.1 hypothetical protein [Salmonella enterica subsp. enterica serovar Typhimurium]MKP52431.1 hypothetical protein [Salmonella enterica subsp. enterica serovar Javiana]HCJ9699651.1 hypothetical protein [Escherichia coli]
MSSLNPIETTLTHQELHVRFIRAFTPPLGGEVHDRSVVAEVKSIGDELITLSNIVTGVEFTLPLNVFRFIPRVNETLLIDRVHHRIMAQVHPSRKEYVRLEMMV